MLRGVPGWRRIKPARSRVRIIWWTEGRVTPKFGRRAPIDACVGIDEGQILALLRREAASRFARHLI